MLRQSLNLNFLIFIFQDLQNLVIVEQVVNFATVDLIHRHGDGKVSLVILPVIDASLE